MTHPFVWGSRPYCPGLYAALPDGRELHVMESPEGGWLATGPHGGLLLGPDQAPLLFDRQIEALLAAERAAGWQVAGRSPSESAGSCLPSSHRSDTPSS